MHKAVEEALGAGRRHFGGASSRKPRNQASLEGASAPEFENLERLCYYDTPCGNLKRKSFRPLPAKTLHHSKIAAIVRKYQHGTAFAITDARTAQSFRNRASLLMKGGHAFQGLSAARSPRG